MEKLTVWTKQNKAILKELKETGRYRAKKAYIQKDLEEHADLVLEVYDWLVKHSPDAKNKPQDVEYPVWVSLKKETTMLPTDGTVILELTLDRDLVTMVNIDKWGMMLNYSYLPANEEDGKAHQALLSQYGVSDAVAYLSQFYPQIKREIIHSWTRLFDPSIVIYNNYNYGNIWEVKKEWITKIIQ